MATAREELEALEAEVQRIRAKRNGGMNREKIRKVLDCIFLVGAFVGVVLYFYLPEEQGGHIPALIVIGIALFLKIMEFILRFTA